ncbi:iron dicitrate transporter FecR [Azorhizobium oxalatiphilum]|uniref:Iron dicitrate transporter FecR n=1 Tax=Azorhizobium oxalatiphilum TaxID=980631 RepID=A0A917FFR3_9HYPH|nr:FecR domain-containing protein [Azorhizobium oxalatiphilum]GGF71539.1 iron dicitrate transporter FecR [Azorhizobium oxalatiphilum]
MTPDTPDRSETEDGFVHPDPVMDAALDFLFMLQAAPDDAGLRARFETWRAADPRHAEMFDAVSGAWDLPELDQVARERAADVVRGPNPQAGGSPAALGPRSRRPKHSRWTRVVLAAAAVVLLALGLQHYPALMLHWRADHMTAAGVRDEIRLPDGSRMVLNTASAVALDFRNGRRSVTLLEGEAYFDVVHDAAHPFTVAANFSEVEVKGTAFSVRTDSAEDTVALEHGHVDVALLPGGREVAELAPGESITASAAKLSAVRPADLSTSLAWLQGRLVFADQPLGQVLSELGRYYGHAIIVADSGLNGVKVNGSYRLDDPERVIRSLAAASGASVTRIPGGILILR